MGLVDTCSYGYLKRPRKESREEPAEKELYGGIQGEGGGSGAGQLKRERIRRRIYTDREKARRDVFDYIEMFYNPKRRHSYADGISPVQVEKQYFNRPDSVY
jgi:transposase InsO family protein